MDVMDPVEQEAPSADRRGLIIVGVVSLVALAVIIALLVSSLSDNGSPSPAAGSDLATGTPGAWAAGPDAPHALTGFATWTGTSILGGSAAPVSGLEPWTLDAYDATARSWKTYPGPTATDGKPAAPRTPYARVWDGSDLLVFGGFEKHTVHHTGPFNTVGTNWAFNPASGQWRPIASQTDAASATSAPNPKQRVQAVWTGEKVVLFAGAGESSTGGTVHTYEFDPATNVWDRYPYDPMPGGSRLDPSVAWDGREIIVWGGVRDPSSTPADPRHDGFAGSDANTRSDGWLYSPKTHKWTAMAEAPVGAVGAATAWTGQQFLVWGGETVAAGVVTSQTKGYAYDPDSNTWTELAAAPFAGLAGVTGVWTGDDFVVWGRTSGGAARGAAYDPVRGTWSRLANGSEVAGPGSAAFWAGDSMLVVQAKQLAQWKPSN